MSLLLDPKLCNSYNTFNSFINMFQVTSEFGFERNVTSVPHQSLCIASMTENEYKKIGGASVCPVHTPK